MTALFEGYNEAERKTTLTILDLMEDPNVILLRKFVVQASWAFQLCCEA